MKFDKILEYQKKDAELLALESEAAKSAEYAAFAAAKARLTAATEAVGKLSHEAAEILSAHTRLAEKAKQLSVGLDEFDGVLEGIENVNEADYYIRQISAISDELAAVEKEVAREDERINGIAAEYKRTWEQGIKANEAYKAALAAFNAYRASVAPRVKEIAAELEAIKKDVPEKMMEVYNSLRGAKKLPAFVPYKVEAGTCGRCFMEVPGDTRGKLKNPGDYAECPNCRRILFIPETN